MGPTYTGVNTVIINNNYYGINRCYEWVVLQMSLSSYGLDVIMLSSFVK